MAPRAMSPAKSPVKTPTKTPPKPRASSAKGGSATKGLTADETKARENKAKKILTRVIFSLAMIFGFLGIVWLGHPYLVLTIVLIQAGLFKELVDVRYRAKAEKHVPLFRTLQWSMFALAMFQTYHRVFVKLGLVNSLVRNLPIELARYVQQSVRFYTWVSFSGYVCVFMTFVLTLKKGLLQYQIGNFVWTCAVLLLVVFQIQGTAVLMFAGIFWFLLPIGLVVANDCFAYICGMTFGRKFVTAPFLKISPNKTWEGFIGAFFCTVAFAWIFAEILSRFLWLTCPQHEFEPFGTLSCEPHAVFVTRPIRLPSDDYALVSVEARPAQLHAVVLGCFASVVAPFGGFFASGVKRAYNIKDFAALIPGHGGFMDRMDCQFLMLLCTYVHWKTFIREHDMSEQHLLRVLETLPRDAQLRISNRLLQILA